jgi:hypothetical protein
MAHGLAESIASFKDFYGITAAQDTVAFVDCTVFPAEGEPFTHESRVIRATAAGDDDVTPGVGNISDAIRIGVYGSFGEDIQGYRVDKVIYPASRREFKKRAKLLGQAVFAENVWQLHGPFLQAKVNQLAGE